MNTYRDKRIKEIFADALEKAEAAERAAYLSQACGNDAQLRQQVEALLQAHEKAGAFLEQPPFAGSGAAPSGGDQKWEGQRHFFGAAAEAMQRILIENARRKQRQKRGGGRERVDVDQIELAEPLASDQLLALDEALTELARRDPPAAELVRLRFFAGLTQQQAADLLGVSRRTADRTWAYARAWLFQQIAGNDKSGA
jgi:RNA polymerase sigma factor (sigma-70 family)